MACRTYGRRRLQGRLMSAILGVQSELVSAAVGAFALGIAGSVGVRRSSFGREA